RVERRRAECSTLPAGTTHRISAGGERVATSDARLRPEHDWPDPIEEAVREREQSPAAFAARALRIIATRLPRAYAGRARRTSRAPAAAAAFLVSRAGRSSSCHAGEEARRARATRTVVRSEAHLVGMRSSRAPERSRSPR